MTAVHPAKVPSFQPSSAIWSDVVRQIEYQFVHFTNHRTRRRGVVDEVERSKNRTKSKVRAKVEHTIGVIKRVFGFTKVRYRGLEKDAQRMFVTCALANLFILRDHLLRCPGP